ncbi:MAG TPA: hypothetical protein VFF67_10725 [Thermoplasmata archaeon]|nr:hypothetical protein [Thermoplasmata archaeon]
MAIGPTEGDRPDGVPKPAPSRPSFLQRIISFFRAHPILTLLVLTPGIPEYLSGSSKLSGLVVAPLVFPIFLALNLGLYGPGVLLIREARVRWKVGFATVAVLAAAYGILEEGVALSTMFDPTSPNVGVLGGYGHWLGVNWIWVPSIVFFHTVFSICLPLLLFDLALPEQRGRSLLTRRGTWIVGSILVVDVLILMAITVLGLHYFMGPVILGASLAVIGGLVLLARRVPPDLLARGRRGLAGSPLAYGLLGLSAFPAVLFSEAIPGALGWPASATFVLVCAVILAWCYFAGRRLTPGRDDRQLIALAAGLVLPVMVFGFVAQFPIEVVLLADLAFGLFLLRLYRSASLRAAAGVPHRSAVPAHVTG